MKHTTKTIASFLIILGAAVGIFFIARYQPESKNPLPMQIGNDAITIMNIGQGSQVSLPLQLVGSVKGTWFFEGSFPVFIYDADGNQLGYGLASSPEDWMTAETIPFAVNLPAVDYQGPATIVFTKDNPTGEAQFDANYTVQVTIQ